MTTRSNHVSVAKAPPIQRLSEVQQARLKEISKRVAQYARQWHLEQPVAVCISQNLKSDRDIFGACVRQEGGIYLQDHWFLHRTDIPNTTDPEKLKRWFAHFMNISLATIDDSFYEQVIFPVVKAVRYKEFEKIREFALLHELGHIYEPLRAARVATRKKVIRTAALFLSYVSIAMIAISIVYATFLLLILFLVAFIGCLLIYRWMAPTTNSSQDNERKADLFAAKTNPQNVSAMIDYLKWLKCRNQALTSNPRVSQHVRKWFTEEGEFAHNTTHPTCSERIANLQQFLHKEKRP